MFNKYQAFSTNPIINVDLTGHFSLEDLLVDIGTFIVFAVAAIATAGAALAAAIIGAEVGVVTASTVVTTVADCRHRRCERDRSRRDGRQGGRRRR